MFAIFPNRFHSNVLTGLTAGIAGLDLYGVHIALPLYAQASGLRNLDVSRLLINKPHFLGSGSLSLPVAAMYLILADSHRS
jgi:hypothetical protein